MKKLGNIGWRLVVILMVLVLGMGNPTLIRADDVTGLRPGQCVEGGGIEFGSGRGETFSSGAFRIWQTRDGQDCKFPGSCIAEGKEVHVSLSGISYSPGEIGDQSYVENPSVNFNLIRVGWGVVQTKSAAVSDGNATASFKINLKNEGDQYRIQVTYFNSRFPGNTYFKCYIADSIDFPVYGACAKDSCSEEDREADDGTSLYNLCLQQIENSPAQARCISCFASEGVWTAIGCIPQDKDEIISAFMKIGLTIAGAVVLIMILVASFMLSTSQGDPKKTQEAKEMITSAIIGLLFVIFSITILQFIGVSIFKIPGFGE